MDEDGVLFAVFASPGEKYTLPETVDPELQPLAGRTFDRFSLAIGGTAALKVPLAGGLPLLHAYGLYEYPDYFEFGGGFSFGVSFLQPDRRRVRVRLPVQRRFQRRRAASRPAPATSRSATSSPRSTVNPCLGVGGVVSSKGFGFCGVLPVPFPVFGTIPVPIGLGYRYGDASPKPMIFSCDYTPYEEASPLAGHTAAASTRAGHIAANAFAVNLPAGLPSAMFRVRGLGAAPDVTVSDPAGHNVTASGDVLTIQGSEPDTTLVGVRHPAGGRWTVTAAPGSVPITDVASAHGLPPIGLHGRVTDRGHRRVLHYRLTALHGRSVTFVERGPGVARVLGVAHRARGKIVFTPQEGRHERRSIVALINGAAGPARQVTVTFFSAPGPVRLGRPTRLRASRLHGLIRVSWRRVAGASRYEILVRLVDNSQIFRVVRGPRALLTDPFPAKRGTVLVDALAASGERGAARTIRIKAVRGKRA